MYYVPLPIPKELFRLFVEPSLGSDPPVRLHLHTKKIRGIHICIHMRYAGFQPAITVDSVNIFAVYYSHNTSSILQRAATTYTPCRAAFVPRFRLFTR
jgi:hypothetical protein